MGWFYFQFMRIFSLFLSIMAVADLAIAEVPKFEHVPDFIKPQKGRETIGSGHGEIAVDSAGLIYVSVQEPGAGLQVYGKDGVYVKTLPLSASMHGFVIRKAEDGEFIYAALVGPEQKVVKLKLSGEMVMEIPTKEFPENKRGPKGLALTGCDVDGAGNIYVVDGYGLSHIFVFSKEGKFKSVFGGAAEPYKFANTHKIFIDKRFSPERLVALDRGNNRMVHLDLDGKILGVMASEGLRRPSSASFHKDLMCVAEIAGRVSLWDKENKLVGELGANTNNTNTPKIAPVDWKVGVVTSPHGITFDNEGNVLETEWNQWGRVLMWKRTK
jgi:hypothetical protein